MGRCYSDHLGETQPALPSAEDALGRCFFWFLKDCFTPCPVPAEYGGCCRAHLFLEKTTRRDNQRSSTVKPVLLKYTSGKYFIHPSTPQSLKHGASSPSKGQLTASAAGHHHRAAPDPCKHFPLETRELLRPRLPC